LSPSMSPNAQRLGSGLHSLRFLSQDQAPTQLHFVKDSILSALTLFCRNCFSKLKQNSTCTLLTTCTNYIAS
jgi:hypothetical protein